VLSRALRVASQRGKVARNVATLVDPPAVKRPTTALPLSAEEARKVLTAAQAHRNAARWTVALAVGLRQSEALGLQWSDVDLANGTLTVRRGLHRVARQGLVYEEPKAERSRRTLALPVQLVEALRAHRAAQLEERVTAGPLWQDNDLVFTQANGRPIERKSDWKAWKNLLNEAGVREVRLHDSRHTAATLLLSEGVHPPGRDGGPRPLADAHHDRHLQPRHARTRPGRGGPDGEGAVGVSWHRIGSSGHHAGTRDDEGRSPSGRTAWSPGWS
jgi:integrase